MIFDKNRMAKLSGLMVESSHKGIKDPKAHNFGGGKPEGDPWLDGEVSTAEHDLHEGDESDDLDEQDDDDEGMAHMEARRKKGEDDEEKAVREMIRTELRKAKKDMDVEKQEEQAVREAVRKEIRSVIKSRGVTMGGLGWGFKR